MNKRQSKMRHDLEYCKLSKQNKEIKPTLEK